MRPPILNRDLRADWVPRHRAVDLGDASPTGVHQFAWSRIWRFATTFELHKYDGPRDDGSLNAERATLAAVYWEHKGRPPAELFPYIDAVLDGIHRHLSGGKPRPRGDAGPSEPGIGASGPELPGAVNWLGWHAEAPDRPRLYERVAGMVLDSLGTTTAVTGLYLYPPFYAVLNDLPPLQRFMLGLTVDEFVRIVPPIVRELGDPRYPLIKPGEPRTAQ